MPKPSEIVVNDSEFFEYLNRNLIWIEGFSCGLPNDASRSKLNQRVDCIKQLINQYKRGLNAQAHQKASEGNSGTAATEETANG